MAYECNHILTCVLRMPQKSSRSITRNSQSFLYRSQHTHTYTMPLPLLRAFNEANAYTKQRKILTSHTCLVAERNGGASDELAFAQRLLLYKFSVLLHFHNWESSFIKVFGGIYMHFIIYYNFEHVCMCSLLTAHCSTFTFIYSIWTEIV